MNQALDTFGEKAVTAAQLARRMLARLGDDTAPGDWVMAEFQVKALKLFAAELGKAFEEALVDRLRRLGDIEIGERRLYAGKVNKTTRTTTAGQMLDDLFTVTGGDIEQIIRCLSNGQKVWKKSEVEEVAPDVHKRSFKTEPVWVLKDGKPTGKQKLESRMTR